MTLFLVTYFAIDPQRVVVIKIFVVCVERETPPTPHTHTHTHKKKRAALQGDDSGMKQQPQAHSHDQQPMHAHTDTHPQGIAVVPPATGQATNMTKQNIQVIVKDYIMKHPEVLMDSLRELEKKMVAKKSGPILPSNV